ncbi:MAG: hypothetical protein ACI9LM_003803 [Alteromonadaceae bacterium]|jgi:hypothetical protein
MFRYWLVLIILFYTTSPFAIEVKNLYVSTVKVSSQTSAERNKALKAAMEGVIIKVGGKSSFLQLPTIKAELENYNSYVRRYRYQRENSGNQLVVTFDEEKINQLLVQENLPIWGRLRPQILLWVVNEEGFNRAVLSDSSRSELPSMIEQFSQTRGLPIIMPMMDLTDANKISISDLWGRFSQPITLASSRYAPEAIIIVRISNSSLVPETENNIDCELLCQQNSYVVDWSFISNANQMSIKESNQGFGQKYQGGNKVALIKLALDDITDNIYKRYALSTTTSNEFTIEVANINTFESSIALTSFLNELSSVQKVKLISAHGNQRRFHLTLLGSQQSLLASLRLNKELQQYIDPLAAVDVNAAPLFYWRKP